MKLAIYCFAWGDSALEERALTAQRELGRQYASRTQRTDRDVEVYEDRMDLIHLGRRPAYERMKGDIYDGEVGEVWARDSTVLYPLYGDEPKSFQALCSLKGVKLSFEMR